MFVRLGPPVRGLGYSEQLSQAGGLGYLELPSWDGGLGYLDLEQLSLAAGLGCSEQLSQQFKGDRVGGWSRNCSLGKCWVW